MNECIELYRVWVAFGVGLFIGGVVGVVVMCVLNMTREIIHGRVAEEYRRYSLEEQIHRKVYPIGLVLRHNVEVSSERV